MYANYFHRAGIGALTLLATIVCLQPAAYAQIGSPLAVELADVEIVYLKHALSDDVANAVQQVIGNRYAKVDVVSEARLNALIVSAQKDALKEIRELIETLDRDAPAVEQQVKIFNLQYASPSPTLLQTLSSMLDSRTQLSFDKDRNMVLAAGTTADLNLIETILLRIDEQPTLREQAAQRKPLDLQVRIVWLVANLEAGVAPDPPKDLENVVKELERVGITNLTMAAQLMVHALEGETFETRGSTNMLPPDKCSVEVSGMLGDSRRTLPFAGSSEDPSLQLSVYAQTDGEQPTDLCQIQTTIKAPIGQSVVLGVTPMDSRQSVFVVQLIDRKKVVEKSARPKQGPKK